MLEFLNGAFGCLGPLEHISYIWEMPCFTSLYITGMDASIPHMSKLSLQGYKLGWKHVT